VLTSKDEEEGEQGPAAPASSSSWATYYFSYSSNKRGGGFLTRLAEFLGAQGQLEEEEDEDMEARWVVFWLVCGELCTHTNI
jgi:hypothetical protein